MPGYFDSIKNPHPPVVAVVRSNVVPLRDGTHPYAQAIRASWLDRLDQLPRPWISGAAWDSNCFVTARKLIELANSPWAGYSLADARADYLAHAPHDHVWDKREKCWEQALDRAGAVALPEPDPTAPLPDVTTLDLTDDRAESIGPPINPIIDWAELFAAEDDGEEWIIEPILPARRMVALYSAPKAGKSLLMLELAVGMARGVEVIGSKPDRPYRVLYVDFENDPRGDVRARLEAMEVKPGQLENLCYLTFPSLAKFDTAQGALDLIRHVEHYQCEVVVIDTVSRAVAGEENENDTWLSFYRHTGLALKRAGIACIRLDHSGKDREKGMRGGSAKYGDVDAVWRLTALSDTTISLECTDHRMPVPRKLMTLEREEFPLRHKAAEEAWAAVADAKALEVDRLLDALGVPSAASVREARSALRDGGHKVRNEAIEKAVKARKMRLDIPASKCPGDTRGTVGDRREEVSPTPPPYRGVGDTSRDTSGDTPSGDKLDPELLVACVKCYRPCSQGYAGKHAGRCPNCAKELA